MDAPLGATSDEHRRLLHGDEPIAEPAIVSTRAVTIDASPDGILSNDPVLPGRSHEDALDTAAPRGTSAELLGPLFRALARLGLFRWFVNRQRLVNSFVTNLRVPEERLTFLAASVTGLLPVAGISGNVTVAFAVMSYAGTLAVTIIADPDAVPDLHVLCAALQNELDAYAHLPVRAARA